MNLCVSLQNPVQRQKTAVLRDKRGGTTKTGQIRSASKVSRKSFSSSLNIYASEYLLDIFIVLLVKKSLKVPLILIRPFNFDLSPCVSGIFLLFGEISFLLYFLLSLHFSVNLSSFEGLRVLLRNHRHSLFRDFLVETSLQNAAHFCISLVSWCIINIPSFGKFNLSCLFFLKFFQIMWFKLLNYSFPETCHRIVMVDRIQL